jgi:hypothetical protein
MERGRDGADHTAGDKAQPRAAAELGREECPQAAEQHDSFDPEVEDPGFFGEHRAKRGIDQRRARNHGRCQKRCHQIDIHARRSRVMR